MRNENNNAFCRSHRERIEVTVGLALSDSGKATSCIEPEELAHFSEKEFPADKREAILNHLDSCHECYSQWKHVNNALGSERTVTHSFFTPKRIVGIGMGMAASLLIVFFGYFNHPEQQVSQTLNPALPLIAQKTPTVNEQPKTPNPEKDVAEMKPAPAPVLQTPILAKPTPSGQPPIPSSPDEKTPPEGDAPKPPFKDKGNGNTMLVSSEPDRPSVENESNKSTALEAIKIALPPDSRAQLDKRFSGLNDGLEDVLDSTRPTTTPYDSLKSSKQVNAWLDSLEKMSKSKTKIEDKEWREQLETGRAFMKMLLQSSPDNTELLHRLQRALDALRNVEYHDSRQNRDELEFRIREVRE